MENVPHSHSSAERLETNFLKMHDKNKELLPLFSGKRSSKGSFDYSEDRFKSQRDLTSFSFSPLEQIRLDVGSMWVCISVCEWLLVSICLVQGLTPESECMHTNLYKSFHFSFLCFPTVQSVSSMFLFPICSLWPRRYTHPLKHFSQWVT